METLPPPEEASDFLASPRTLLQIEQFLGRGAMEGGFVLAGGDGVGKATLAFLLAATVLSGGQKLGAADPKVRSLIAAGAHPDLAVMRRQENEKTGKLRQEIDVDQARKVIAKLHQTSASGRSVVIVDIADELNRNAANSLLKVLEEPPKGAVLFLLSRSPSRLLPTLTSRCRKISLHAVEEDALATWLSQRTGSSMDEARALARDAEGAPGRALRLALGEGQEATSVADSFLRAVEGRQDLLAASRKFAGKGQELIAEEARGIVLARLRRRLTEDGIENSERGRRIDAYDQARALFSYIGTADPAQTALVAGLRIRDAMAGKTTHVR